MTLYEIHTPVASLKGRASRCVTAVRANALTPRAVADREDFNRAAGDAVANEVRRDGDKFASPITKRSTSQGMISKAVGRHDQARGETLRGQRRELADIVADAGQIGLRSLRPHDPVQRRQSPTCGAGNSSAVPQDDSQVFIASWLITRPASASASPSAVAASSAASSRASKREGSGFIGQRLARAPEPAKRPARKRRWPAGFPAGLHGGA